jgi:hypothetical protein
MVPVAKKAKTAGIKVGVTGGIRLLRYEVIDHADPAHDWHTGADHGP